MQESLQQHYGYLFEDDLLKEISACGSYRRIAQGNVILEIGDAITHMPLLLEGAIKILREAGDGDELLLYFLERGDTCAMTFSCCMGKNKSEIRAVAENDTELLMVPMERMEAWMAKYPSWRAFVLESYHNRMIELLETLDMIAFMRLDERLLKYLQDKAKVTHDDSIYTTHKEVAHDLHTSRVVISRLLKKLEKEGKIEMHRNHLKVLDL